MEELTETYSPLWAQHVKGRYTKLTVDEDGQREEQKVEAYCEKCGARYKNVCKQGMPRQHIQRFSTIHLHRGALAAPPKKA